MWEEDDKREEKDCGGVMCLDEFRFNKIAREVGGEWRGNVLRRIGITVTERRGG